MTFNKKRYAIKYGVIYSIIVAVILITPLFVYVQLMINVNEAKTKVDLEKRALEILYKMDRFKPSQEAFFTFPRYSAYEAGLYDENFKPIFTLIPSIPKAMNQGYYNHKSKRFYVLSLAHKKYFDAAYLVVQKEINNYDIYQMALLIGLLILAMLFVLSYFILNNFALPFEQVNTQLDTFMKDAMHEINTPLSIINVNVDLYARKHGANRYFNRIKAASKTLSTIYNDMDYLIKQEIVDYPLTKIDMSRFLADRIDYFKEVATLREIEITSQIHSSLTLMFNTTKLQRVIDNTLSNAIKYSYENGLVEVSLTKEVSQIILEIKDHGVGIAHPEKIFERYYRENLDKGGFGIGLNIVKKIIDTHHVGLEIKSVPKHGSSFIYTFPA